MEGYLVTEDGKRKAIVSPDKNTPPKKKPFVGITPIKDYNFERKTEKSFRVSIEGNIGAGKSSFIKLFEDLDGIETYSEPIDWWRNLDGHNLLELLYKDINMWLNTFQSYVQLSRLKIQSSKPKSNSTVVQMFERSVQNNRYCFLEQAHDAGYLHGGDYAILDKWYRWIIANVDIRLDLIVYLRTSPEVVYERMKARGRPEESTVSLEYLQQLHDSHEKWLMTNDEKFNTVPVLVINADVPFDEVLKQCEEKKHIILGREQDESSVQRREQLDNARKELEF